MKKGLFGIIARGVIAAIYRFYGKGFGGAYRELAEETGSVLVPNVFATIMGTRSLMSDPIHPNSQGYTVMAQHFFRALQPYL